MATSGVGRWQYATVRPHPGDAPKCTTPLARVLSFNDCMLLPTSACSFPRVHAPFNAHAPFSTYARSFQCLRTLFHACTLVLMLARPSQQQVPGAVGGRVPAALLWAVPYAVPRGRHRGARAASAATDKRTDGGRARACRRP
eukprot:362934-Chlamydomonas_euryale.AAC.3